MFHISECFVCEGQNERQYGSFDINGNFFLQSCCDWPLRNFNHLSQGVYTNDDKEEIDQPWSIEDCCSA